MSLSTDRTGVYTPSVATQHRAEPQLRQQATHPTFTPPETKPAPCQVARLRHHGRLVGTRLPCTQLASSLHAHTGRDHAQTKPPAAQPTWSPPPHPPWTSHTRSLRSHLSPTSRTSAIIRRDQRRNDGAAVGGGRGRGRAARLKATVGTAAHHAHAGCGSGGGGASARRQMRIQCWRHRE